jgi:inner membrane protein
MDSLTQIILGAACGEAVLGKKIGNKALLFGAIGGTIPDLDVFIGRLFYTNEIDIMLFHRGFMHSILFSALGALLFGWLVFKVYNKGMRLHSTTLKNWVSLFFWSLFTHPILDCFTPYGTQLFAPFSNYRVAFNNIAVADPFYTMPFLVCVIVLMFYNRTSVKRRKWLIYGFAISSIYMVFTIGNKLYVNSIFKSSLADEDIAYSRFSAQPSIFNNILWYGIAETESSYKVAYYSLLDNNNRFSQWLEIPKTRAITTLEYKDLKELSWFSNGYYSVDKSSNNFYLYNDLRYPLIETKAGYESVFSLYLFKDNNRLNMKSFEPKVDDFGDAMSKIWERLKGL